MKNNNKKNYQRVLALIFIVVVLLLTIGISYSFFRAPFTNNNEEVSMQSGNLSLVFSDGNAGINEKLEFGGKVVKTFTVENNGSLDAGFVIKWKDLINTYQPGSLGYTLESSSSEAGPYTIETSNDYDSLNSLYFWYKNQMNMNYEDITKIEEHLSGNITFEELAEFLFNDSISNIPEEELQSLREIVEEIKEVQNQKLVPSASSDLSKVLEIKSGEKKYYKLSIILNNYTDIDQTADLNAAFSSTFEIEESLVPVSGELMRRVEDKIWKSDEFDIKSIVFEDKLEPKANAEYTYDISELQDGSVMSYLVSPNENNLTRSSVSQYILYIQADGEIIANPDSSYLFEGLRILESIDGLENLNTSYVRNMEGMFTYCSNLTTLDLNNFDTSNVASMEGMFAGCSGLTSLDLSNFNTGTVTNMSGMFYGCSNLTSLDVSNFDTSNVTIMYSMFQGCNNLTTLDLSNFDTSNVTNMYGLFAGCNDLTTLNLSNFNTGTVTNMSGMFAECSNLTSLDVSNFDTNNVTSMESMFEACNNLTTTLTIHGTKTSIYNNMFLDAATETGAQITVNYTSDASNLVDNMIATKSSNSNIVKGNLVTA